jgi:hypothetical protein
MDPPDTGAAMNWLKNRMPDKWRDKIDHDINADVKRYLRSAVPTPVEGLVRHHTGRVTRS